MDSSTKVEHHLRLSCSVLTLGLCFALTNVGFAPRAKAATYYVTIAGLGGEPEYANQFGQWAGSLEHELQTGGGADVHTLTLAGPAATRSRILDELGKLREQVQPVDALALFLIGHGTFDGTEYKFNVPGPDITAADLKASLDRVTASRQLVVNMTSCSGASLKTFAHKGRIVITATKSGTEKNAPVFARYWVDALKDPSADTDKNGTISALEAFRYAQTKVTAYFESEKLLATEHALFTDNGSGNAIRDPKTDNGQGLLAASFPLIRPSADSTVAADPAKQSLLKRKQEVEGKIDRLKYDKNSLSETEYKQQLTSLLVQLARLQAEIDR